MLTLEEIEVELESEFARFYPDFVELRLRRNGLNSDQLGLVESELEIRLPEDFCRVVSKYDFGFLTISQISFGTGSSFDSELLRMNREVAWWGGGVRPREMIMCASCDPYAIVLHSSQNMVGVIDPEVGMQGLAWVSRGFRNFVRGVGTISVMRLRGSPVDMLAQEIATETGAESSEFWRWLSS